MVKFDECAELGDNSLEIVHGYKHGSAIRAYIRSQGFLKDAFRNGHEIVGKNFSDKGATKFQLAPSKKPLKKSLKTKLILTGNASKNKVQTDFCHKCDETMILIKELNWYKCPKCGKLKKR